jgi:hypothetical protein
MARTGGAGEGDAMETSPAHGKRRGEKGHGGASPARGRRRGRARGVDGGARMARLDGDLHGENGGEVSGNGRERVRRPVVQ